MSLTYGSGTWLLRWNSTSSGYNYITLASINTNKHTLKVVNGHCYFDNISKETISGHNSNLSIKYNLFLFTINPANTTPSDNAKCKIYEYKDIDNNGNLIRHMVPAQYNGEYGMWDLVEDKFYRNAGTGSFTVGPEIKNYDEIYEVRRTSSILPAGVELYDYIGNNGSQWIDTCYASNSNTKIETQISSSITSPIEFYGGSSSTSANFRLFILGGYLYAASGKDRTQNVFSPSVNTVYTAVHTHTSLTINGTSYSTASGSAFSGASIKLFRDPGYIG